MGTRRGKFCSWLVGASVVSLGCLLASATFAAGGKEANSPKADRTGLVAKEMQAKGVARVIVTVSTALDPESMQLQLASDTGRAAAIAAIESATTKVTLRHFGPSNSANGFAISKFKTSPSFAVTVNQAQLDALYSDPSVVSVKPDLVAKTQLVVTTATIGMRAAWAGGAYGTNRTVAIIDTGVQANHPFIGTSRVVLEGCFLTTNGCPNGTNEQTGAGSSFPTNNGISHGTHVSGIAMGKNTVANAQPYSGVSKWSKLLAINVFDSDGFTRSSSMVRALEYVEDRVINQPTLKITSVNMSIGGGDYSDYCDGLSPDLKAVVDRLLLKQVAVVVSAGNDSNGDMMSWPGCVSSVVSVGATNRAGDRVAYYSNIDTSTRLLAPGGDANNDGAVVSSILGSAYAGYQGTSMAAPHVAGALAALASKFTGERISIIEDALRRTGVPVADSNRGAGIGTTIPRIQVANALNMLAAPTPPANDAFGAATNIATLDGLDVWGSTGGGSRQTGEPSHGIGPSSWWKWTAPAKQKVTVSTIGSNFDTILAVYTGSAVNALTQVKYNNNADATTTSSSVTFWGLPGVTYRIAVAGKGAKNAGVVHLTAALVPTNTSAAQASPVAVSSSRPTFISGSNFDAPTEANEPAAKGPDSVWWKFTAPSAGAYTIDTVGSMTRTGNPLDTKIAVYSGSAPSALTLVGADDDSGPGAYSKITFNAVAGGTYYLAVGGYDHSGLGSPDESGKLRVTVTPPGYVRRDAKATLAR